MRFVNEIHWSTQVSVGSNGPYCREKGMKKASGFPVEVLISVCKPPSSPFPEDGDIEIEGDAACILDALEKVCFQLRAIGAHYVEKHDLDPDWKHKAERLQATWQKDTERLRTEEERKK